EKVEQAEDDPQSPRRMYVARENIGVAQGGVLATMSYIPAVAIGGAIVASGGTAAGALIGALMAGGAGGLIGSILSDLIADAAAEDLAEQIEHGGLLLFVRLADGEHEAKAVEILKE